MTTTSDSMTPEEIKAARRAIGMTQQGLANALHLHLSTIASWEQGTQPISGPALVAMRYMLREPKP